MKWIIVVAGLLPSIAFAETAPSGASAPVGDQLTSHPHSCASYYPEAADDQNMSGTTQLKFTISTDGEVSGIQIAKSSGHAELDDAAISCAKSWRYKPAMNNGAPVEMKWAANILWNPGVKEVPSCVKFYSGPPVDFSGIGGTTEMAVSAYKGEITNIVVTKSSGNSALDASAVACEGMTHYVATDERGDPVSVQTNVKIDWKIVFAHK